MLEVELKYRCDDFAPVSAALEQMQAIWDPPGDERDRYFSAPDRDYKATGEALRLRESRGNVYLTYKGPKIDTVTKSREELEILLGSGPGVAENWLEMFDKLGYRVVGTVQKHRRKARVPGGCGPICVYLDEVAQVGRYVEIEMVVADPLYDRARADVLELAGRLGFEQPERRSYLTMTLSARAGG